MEDNIFLDSNVVVYAHTDLDLRKKTLAQGLISSDNFNYVSTQVLQEVSNTLSKKFRHSWADIVVVLDQVKTYSTVNVNRIVTIDKAIEVALRYKYSFYDSLIVAAALECQCSIIYSEDMQSGQIIEGMATIVNPFAALS